MFILAVNNDREDLKKIKTAKNKKNMLKGDIFFYCRLKW